MRSAETSASQNSDSTSGSNSGQNSVDIVPLRRSSRVSKAPVWLQSYKTKFPNTSAIAQTAQTASHMVHFQFNCFSAALTASTDLVSFKQAVQYSHWVSAMITEIEDLEMNGTWEIIPLPVGKKPIGCKWLYKTKYKSDGSIERYKSRLVALGCKKQYGIDYLDTFAPVVKMTTVRTLLAVAAICNWSAVQMDVNNAFLHGGLDEDVYMVLPQGYTSFGSRIQLNQATVTQKVELVCKVLKSLYGLKQAPRQWFSKLSETLIKMGFLQPKSDYSLFIKQTDKCITLILVYVDDLLICGNSDSEIEGLKVMLSQAFHMKDLGNLSYFLGLEIDRSTSGFFTSKEIYT